MNVCISASPRHTRTLNFWDTDTRYTVFIDTLSNIKFILKTRILNIFFLKYNFWLLIEKLECSQTFSFLAFQMIWVIMSQMICRTLFGKQIKYTLKNNLRRNKIRSVSENFVFAENFSIGVKLGENRMGESVFGFDPDITWYGKKG